jgi:hypothetical protein
MADSSEKKHARELIERLAPRQVSAVVSLLEAMLDPVAQAIAQAPVDDEPEREQERKAVAESKSWFERHREGVPHEQVLRDFDLGPGDSKAKRKNRV